MARATAAVAPMRTERLCTRRVMGGLPVGGLASSLVRTRWWRGEWASGPGIAQHDVGVAVRAGADDRQRAAGQLLQRAQVGASRRRQLVPLGNAMGAFLPARELQVDRRALVPALRIQGCVFAALAVVLVGDADLQRLHPVEDVELGDAQPGDAVDRDGALERDHVHPSAAARAAGGGAVLLAAVADALPDLVVQFGRERAAADAGGVSLGDAEH